MNKDILQDDVISQDILQPIDNLPNRDVLRDTQATGAVVRSSLPKTQRVRTDTGYAIYKLKGNRYVFDYEVINLPFGQIQRKANGEKEADIDPTTLVNFLQSKGYTVTRNGSKITITVRDEVYEIDLNRLTDSDIEFLKVFAFPEQRLERALDTAFQEYGLDFFFRNGRLFATNSFNEEREYFLTPRGVRVKDGHEILTSFGGIHISPISLRSPNEILTQNERGEWVYDVEKIKNLVKTDPVLRVLAERNNISFFFRGMDRETFNKYSGPTGITFSETGFNNFRNRINLSNIPADKPVVLIKTDLTGSTLVAYVYNEATKTYDHHVLFTSFTPDPLVTIPITSLYSLTVFSGGVDAFIREDDTYKYYHFYYGDSTLPMLIKINKQTGERIVVPRDNFTSQELEQVQNIIRGIKDFVRPYEPYWNTRTAEHGFWYPWFGENPNIVPLGKDGLYYYIGTPDGTVVYRVTRNTNPSGAFSITKMGYEFIDSTVGMQVHETTFTKNLYAPYNDPITNYFHEEYVPYFLRNSHLVRHISQTKAEVWDPDDQYIYVLDSYNRTATRTNQRVPYIVDFDGSYRSSPTMQTMQHIFNRSLGSTTNLLEALQTGRVYAEPKPLTKLLSAAYGYADLPIDLGVLRNIAKNAYNISVAGGAMVYAGSRPLSSVNEIDTLDKTTVLSLRYVKQLNTGGTIEGSIYELLSPSAVQSISQLTSTHLRAFIQDNQSKLEMLENLQAQLEDFIQTYTRSVRPEEREYFAEKIKSTSNKLEEIVASIKVQQGAPLELKEYVKLINTSVDTYLKDLKNYLKKIDEIYEDARKNRDNKNYGDFNDLFEYYKETFRQIREMENRQKKLDDFKILSTELELTTSKLSSFLEKELTTGVAVATQIDDKKIDKGYLGNRVKELTEKVYTLAGELGIKTPDMLDGLSRAFMLGEFATNSYRSNDILDELKYYKELYKKYEDPFMKELIETKIGALVYPVINNKDVTAIEKLLNLNLPDRIQNLLEKTRDTINDERLLNSLEGKLSSFLKNKTVGDLLRDSFVKEYKNVFNSVRDKLKTEEARALLSSMESEFDYKIAVARDYINRNKELNVEFTEIKNEPLAPIFRIVDLGLTTSLLGGIGGSVVPVIGTKIGTIVGGLIGIGAGFTYETLTGWQTTTKTKTTEKIQTINLNEPLLLDTNSQKTFNTLFGLVPPTETKDPFYTGLKNIKKQESVAKPMTPVVPEVVNLFIGDLVSKGTNPYDIYYDPKTGIVKVKKVS